LTRYLLVVPEFPPEVVGGGGIVFLELARRYASEGDLLVLTGSWSSSRQLPITTKLDGGGTIVRVPLIRDKFDVPAFRSTFPPTRSGRHFVRTFVRHWQPTVAHLHGYGYLLIDWVASLLRSSGVPFVFTSHGLPVSYGSGRARPVKTAAFRLYEASLASHTVRCAGSVTAISQLAAPPQRKATIVPNGISPLPTPSADALRPTQDGVRRIATAGRLVPSKGFDILIQALANVRKSLIECTIAGADGGDLRRLQTITAGLPRHVTVHFPGPLDRQRIANLFAASDLVAMPSMTEPFGLVAFEALSAGKRVIATRTGGLADWLSDPDLPVELVTPGDIDQMSLAIRVGITAGSTNASEQASVQRLFQRLDWDSVTAEYLRLMNCLAVTRSPQSLPAAGIHWWRRRCLGG